MEAAADAGSTNALERFFKFKQWNTSLKRDTLAGLTTFIVMSYIIFVNPSILGLGGKGLPFAAALTSTCLVAGVMTILMGVVSNRDYAIAPGMGLNAVVAFSLVLGQGLSFKSAMGLIVLEGVAITILVLTGFREAIFKAIPLELKKAIVIGIGFFILFIGLVDGGIVISPSGDATAPALIIVGFLMMATLTKGEAEAEHDDHEPKAAINFSNLAFGIPAVLIMTIMPLTYSITNGIGFGFIAYTLIRVVQGRARDVSWMLWIASAGFIIYFLAPLFQAKGWV